MVIARQSFLLDWSRNSWESQSQARMAMEVWVDWKGKGGMGKAFSRDATG